MSEKYRFKGYRIDGVAACRLAWQWFRMAKMFDGHPKQSTDLPGIGWFKDRSVVEPLAVRLAGEYDVWDHRDEMALPFQYGLDAQKYLEWELLLTPQGRSEHFKAEDYVRHIVEDGCAAMRCYAKRDADIMRSRSFVVYWENLWFLALNTARCNSNTFAAKDVSETGHDALMGFYYNGTVWTISLYHAKHRTDIDLSQIAVKYGGGGHRGACGFQTKQLPF